MKITNDEANALAGTIINAKNKERTDKNLEISRKHRELIEQLLDKHKELKELHNFLKDSNNYPNPIGEFLHYKYKDKFKGLETIPDPRLNKQTIVDEIKVLAMKSENFPALEKLINQKYYGAK